MFQTWRLKLRQATVAYQRGDLDEARDLLQQDDLHSFLPAKKLAAKVANEIAHRGRSRAALGDTTAGWGDLRKAAALGGAKSVVVEAREGLMADSLSRVIRLLIAGHADLALAGLGRIERRQALSRDALSIRSLAGHVQLAKDARERGRLADAAAELKKAESIVATLDDPSLMQAVCGWRQEVEALQQDARGLSERLHAAVAREDWSEVLAIAETMLEVAPRWSAAREARKKAWEAVGMHVTQVHRPSRNHIGWVALHRDPAPLSTRGGARNSQEDTVSKRTPGQVLQMWVDAVGGFLICLGDEIVLGQPSQQHSVEVPILGDLSRRHAIIRRDGGAYILEPVHRTTLNEHELKGPAVLQDGAMIQLGESVRIRFRRPHALSATARLEFVSHHKTEPGCDAVLLMAETCVLGPQPHSHVRCKNWEQDIVLFRRGSGMACRAKGTFQIDGEGVESCGPITPQSRIEGDDFCVTLEAV